MSLVIEALRRVEKPGAHPGILGVAVAPHGPRPRRTSLLPLFLGLATGGVFVFFWGPPFWEVAQDKGVTEAGAFRASTASPRASQGRAGLPPVLIPDGNGPIVGTPASGGASAGLLPRRRAKAARIVERQKEKDLRPAFVLQALSLRDGSPIAVINDVLVREGDWLAGARIVKIGSDSVEIIGPDGRPDTVRFAPIPDPTPEPTPSFEPHSSPR